MRPRRKDRERRTPSVPELARHEGGVATFEDVMRDLLVGRLAGHIAVEGAQRTGPVDGANQHAGLPGLTGHAETGAGVTHQCSGVRIHAHQFERQQEGHGHREKADGALLVVEVEQVRVGLGGAVKFADLLEVEAPAEFRPNGGPETVAESKADFVRSIRGPRRLR